MNYKLVTAAFAFALSTIIFSSCKKKDDTTPDYTTTSEVNSVRDDLDDALKVSEDALSSNGQFRTGGSLSSCATVTLDGPNKMITLDFGSIGCLGNDGHFRQGKLIVTYTDLYRTTGAIITIKTDNYIVNSKKIDGMRVVTNAGLNTAGNIVYTVVDSDLLGTGYSKITQTDGSISTWKASSIREWSAGSSTPLTVVDDEHIISGIADGVTSKGVVYSLTATAIKVKASCWATLIFVPVSGSFKLTTADGSRSIDYGDGTCDRNATYTHTNGKTYAVTLY